MRIGWRRLWRRRRLLGRRVVEHLALEAHVAPARVVLCAREALRRAAKARGAAVRAEAYGHVLLSRFAVRVDDLDVLVASRRRKVEVLPKVDGDVLVGVPSVDVRLKVEAAVPV